MTKLKNVILVLMTLLLVFSCTLVSADVMDTFTDPIATDDTAPIVDAPIVEENITAPLADNSTESVGNFTESIGNLTVGNFTKPIVTLVTPTPIPTLASMANAKLMSDGAMYPNYKVEKYNILDDVPDYGKFGYAKFYLRAGGSALDLNVWIVKNGENVTPFDAAYNPDKSEIKDQNADYKLIKILPDGESDVTDKLDAGEWTAYIQNGNGGQMETQTFNVGGGEITRVSLLGHAVSSSPIKHKPVYAITSATYGAPFAFYVTSATYGIIDETPSHNIDVTSIVQSLVTGKSLNIIADYNPNQHYNKLFTDPIYGTVKTLTVNYIENGVAKSKSVSETDDFNLDITSTGSSDVTPYFVTNLNDNVITTTMTGSTSDWAWLNSFRADPILGASFADPSVNTVKSITVEYTKDGVAKSFTTLPDVNGYGTTITLP